MTQRSIDASRSMMNKSRSSSHHFEFSKKHKREMVKAAQQLQKDFNKGQIDEEEDVDVDEDLYDNEIYIKRTFTDLGAKLYQSYMSLLLGEEEKLKKLDPNKIMSSYLNNGLQYEQDYLDERDHHPGDLVIEFPNPDYSKRRMKEDKKKNEQSKDKSKDKIKETQDKETTLDQSREDSETDEPQTNNKNGKESISRVKRVSLNQAKDDFKKAFNNFNEGECKRIVKKISRKSLLSFNFVIYLLKYKQNFRMHKSRNTLKGFKKLIIYQYFYNKGMVDASLRADVSENKIFQITFENSFKKLSQYPEGRLKRKQEENDSNYNDSMFEDDIDEIIRGDETDTLLLMRNLLFSKKQDTQKSLTKCLTKKHNHLANTVPAIKKVEDEMFDLKLAQQDKSYDGKQVTQNNPQNTQMIQKFLRSEKVRKIYKGGKFFQINDNKVYERTTNPTKDYLTLVRHATWIRLVKHGFKLRHFISQNGKSIFTVCYATDENLKITAEKEKLSKALNLEFSDILSLEPVNDIYDNLLL